jgi:hypothetical protein
VSISTVTVGGNEYPTYATVAEADALLLVDSSRSATWAAATAEAKAARLAEATRLLGELCWLGEPVSPPDRWPRTGMLDRDGEPLPSDDVPPEVELATARLAADLVLAAGGGLSPASNQKKVVAGPVSVEFFAAQAAQRYTDELGQTLGHLVCPGSLPGMSDPPSVPASSEAWQYQGCWPPRWFC